MYFLARCRLMSTVLLVGNLKTRKPSNPLFQPRLLWQMKLEHQYRDSTAVLEYRRRRYIIVWLWQPRNRDIVNLSAWFRLVESNSRKNRNHRYGRKDIIAISVSCPHLLLYFYILQSRPGRDRLPQPSILPNSHLWALHWLSSIL